MTQVLDNEATPTAPVAIDPRILERREEVARQRSRRRWRVALTVGGVVVVVSGGWAIVHSPVLAARHVTVVGAVHTGVGPIIAAVGLNGQPLVDVNPGRVAARVEALPWVAHATVTRHWPNDVTVTVVERVASAVVTNPGRGAVLVDAEGRVLSSVPTAPPGTVVLAVPVTPGLPGSMLGAPAAPGLAALDAVPPLLERRLEQVDVADDGDVTLALTGHIGVTLGPAVELAAKFEALLSVLVDVPPKVPELIDVTVPDAPAVGPPAPPGAGAGSAARTVPPVRVGESSDAPQVRQRRRGPS
ncbi:MAG TPA: FtsQ-type POTRA domain-containing protein [Acidimicrobiales bacterium]|jgi:cell division protein FtsQ|nr:FtsQ-type POTRA domain-containing protein [Acidimicrobiales bacterium]